jgi:tetratricopeptide (TPR) repeat protein
MKDQMQEEIVMGNMAAAYNQQGDFRQAIAYLEQSLTIAQAINDREGILMGSLNLGNSQFMLGSYDQAINTYLFCLNQLNEPAYTLQKGIVLGSLGKIYHAMADYDTAEKHFTQSLQIARGIADHSGEATALGGLGITELMRRHYPPAITHFRQALEIAQKFHYVQNEEKLLGHLGTAFYEQASMRLPCVTIKNASC